MSARRCAAPGCREPVQQPSTGRPRRYHNDACRQRAYRKRHRRHKLSALFSSKSDEWSTPQDFFDEVSAEFGGFDLDVAATAQNAKCPVFFTREDDGLAQEWRGRCWMNPPHSDIAAWMKAWQASQTTAELVVCLVPSRTGTNGGASSRSAARLCSCAGVCASRAKNDAPFASAVVVFRNSETVTQLAAAGHLTVICVRFRMALSLYGRTRARLGAAEEPDALAPRTGGPARWLSNTTHRAAPASRNRARLRQHHSLPSNQSRGDSMTEQDRIEANLNEAKERTPKRSASTKRDACSSTATARTTWQGPQAFWSLSSTSTIQLLRLERLDYDTQEDWLAQPELGFDRSAYFRMIGGGVSRGVAQGAVEPFQIWNQQVDLVSGNRGDLVGTKDALEKHGRCPCGSCGWTDVQQREDPAGTSGAEDDEPAVGSGEEAVPERETEDTEPQREEAGEQRRLCQADPRAALPTVRDARGEAADSRVQSASGPLRADNVQARGVEEGMVAGLSEAGQFTITERVWALRVEHKHGLTCWTGEPPGPMGRTRSTAIPLPSRR